jgi:hypothetical protein
MQTFTEELLIKDNEFGDLEDLEFIKQSMMFIKDIKQITCHNICRAFSRVLGMKVETGYWLAGFEHSWLLTQHNNIIDVYPWGVVGGPILVHKRLRNRLIYQKAKINRNIVDTKQIKRLAIIIAGNLDTKIHLQNIR